MTGESGKRDRFRRPDWPRPEEGEAPEATSEAASELPAVVDPAQIESLKLVMKPLSDLADAFRENSETLRGVAEGQIRLGKRLERSDRSEAVMQSTQALNETFRGVHRTQERLLSRIDEEKKRPWRLVAFSLALVALLVGGLVWFLLGWVADREQQAGSEGVSALAEELSRREETVADLHRDLTSRSEEAVRSESRLLDEQRIAGELAREVEQLTRENEELLSNRAALSSAVRESARLAEENSRHAERLESLRAELMRSREREVELEAEVESLKGRLAELARRILAPPESVPPESVPPGPGISEPRVAAPAPAPSLPSSPAVEEKVPAGAVTDPAELGRLTTILNRLLLASGKQESYRFESIGGVRGKVLYAVTIVNQDEEGREAKRIVAARARIVLDSSRKRVEIRLQNGHIVYYGVRAPFWGGQYVIPVVGIDSTAWHRSGLRIFEEL